MEYHGIVYVVHHLSVMIDDDYLCCSLIQLFALDYLRIMRIAYYQKLIVCYIRHCVVGSLEQRLLAFNMGETVNQHLSK